jgi:preprotein translocase subunit SecY
VFIALARTGELFANTFPQDSPSTQIIPENSGIPLWLTLTAIVITMTAGTGVVMWLGELITDRGVGNGMSVLIFTSIAARLPSEGWRIKQESGVAKFLLVIALVLVVICAVVFIEQAQRRIPVQYAKRMIGRRLYGGTSTYIPLKVNQAGVVPVIFASSLLYLPQLYLQFFDQNNLKDYQIWIHRYLADATSPFYIGVYFLLIIFFTYFYVSITFNPEERAEDMKKYGGFIPGIRPGRPTAEYLTYVLNRITLPGALYLGIGLGEPVLDHGDRDLVGPQVAGVHVGLGLLAQLGPTADVGPEDVAGRDVRDLEVLGDEGRLRPRPGSRGTHENHTHQRRNPS